MAREPDAGTQEYVAAARARAGVEVVLSDDSVFSSLGLVRALQRNEVVAIQLDRPAGAGGVRLLPFLGAPAPFPSGPFVLARLAGAPVIPVFAPRLGRRHYRIQIGRPVEVPRAARDPRAARQRGSLRPPEVATDRRDVPIDVGVSVARIGGQQGDRGRRLAGVRTVAPELLEAREIGAVVQVLGSHVPTFAHHEAQETRTILHLDRGVRVRKPRGSRGPWPGP